MSNSLRNNGFSLTEVLMAAGILAIGFAFIAGMFPVGVKLTALATEQTIAPIVADEATAKIRLYGEIYNASPTDPNSLIYKLAIAAGLGYGYVDFSDALLSIPRGEFDEIDEFAYPSTDISPQLKKYHWSALCGLLGDGNIHVTIFVSRKTGAGAKYRTHNIDYFLPSSDYGQEDTGASGDWPVPVKVLVTASGVLGEERLLRIDPAHDETLINAGCTIVDDLDGSVYRVLERTSAGVITLDRDWEGLASGYVWVVPPAKGSGRNPCIGVYQTVIGF
ncbi:MAG: type IV pilus modification PilV family protein [Planctomycetota bacterium]